MLLIPDIKPQVFKTLKHKFNFGMFIRIIYFKLSSFDKSTLQNLISLNKAL